jgi:hypothetical protein|tara:strand:+ start:4405 stop:4665 length:261 start_codon:yes stop_codon:yes gene_type:complete
MSKPNVEVTGIRYFETRRGIGYQCKTNLGFEIWNDGDGGATYIDGAGVMPNREVYSVLKEQFPNANPQGYDFEEALEGLINKYEGV